jgi:hypothetical protein
MVTRMEEEHKELITLKSLYDELWSDARTMVKDMRRSISLYLYSAMVTFTVAAVTITYAFVYVMNVILGNANLLNYLGAVGETAASVVIVAFGVALIRWYRKLRKKYSRLIQIEKELED